MSSVCSSPVSQRFSTTPPPSPQTTVTTPASGGASPKFSSYNFTPSPQFSPQTLPQTLPHDEQKGRPVSSDGGSLFSVSACFPASPSSPPANNNNNLTVVRPVMIDPAIEDQTLSAYDQAFQQYFQYQPSEPQGYDAGWLQTALLDDGHSEQEEPSFWSNYTGYPPACAFYGPGWVSSSSPVDPWEYQAEQWQTAGGRKVEYSAMHLHCATM